MTKLDEIERHANRALISTSQLDDEVNLLIRAVKRAVELEPQLVHDELIGRLFNEPEKHP